VPLRHRGLRTFSGVQSAMLAESHTRACIRQRTFLGQEKINRLKEKIKKSPIVKDGDWLNGGHTSLVGC